VVLVVDSGVVGVTEVEEEVVEEEVETGVRPSKLEVEAEVVVVVEAAGVVAVVVAEVE